MIAQFRSAAAAAAAAAAAWENATRDTHNKRSKTQRDHRAVAVWMLHGDTETPKKKKNTVSVWRASCRVRYCFLRRGRNCCCCCCGRAGVVFSVDDFRVVEIASRLAR